MRAVHIALVGGQPAPVYYGISGSKPDVVVFIYSQESELSIDSIKRRLESSNIHCVYEDYTPLDPTNPNAIVKCAEAIVRKYYNEQITLNISGGTKSWSHLFAKVLESHPNARVVYVDQLNRLWDYSDYSVTQIRPLELVQHLELYGNEIRNYTKFSDYAQNDDDAVKMIETARQYNFNDFNLLTTVLNNERNRILQHKDSGKWFEKTGSYIEWVKGNNNHDGWVRLLLNKYNGQQGKEFFIESKHATQLVFNAGWFEYKIARMLSKWPLSKEVLMNCKFKTKTGADKNEADIIIQTSSRLIFVECKTKLTKITDIDKFKTVVSVYGGTAALGIFITDSPMDNRGLEKCDNVKLLPSFAYSSQKEDSLRERALFSLLDNAIKQINK